jgi:uncharacterized phage protein gp47/JayE
VFEGITPEYVKADIISRVSADIDTREGSFVRDMISAAALEIAKVYQSLDAVVPIAFVDETSGEFIDKRTAEYGITRKPGAKATVTMNFTGTDGTVIPAGKVFLTATGLQYETNEAVTVTGGTASVTATAVEIGAQYNVDAGAIAIQLNSLSGLASFSNLAAANGTDAETDTALVRRLADFLKNRGTSGNAADYRQWAMAVEGVGGAKVVPIWDGPGTVKVLLMGADGGPVESSVATACAAAIETARPIGPTVTVLSAVGLDIDVTANVDIEGTTLADVKTAFETALDAYLKDEGASETPVIAYYKIAYLLMAVRGVTDIVSLTVNGGTVNVSVDDDEVPVRGTVVIS